MNGDDAIVLILDTKDVDRLRQGDCAMVDNNDGHRKVILAWTADPKWLNEQFGLEKSKDVSLRDLIEQSQERPDIYRPKTGGIGSGLN